MQVYVREQRFGILGTFWHKLVDLIGRRACLEERDGLDSTPTREVGPRDFHRLAFSRKRSSAEMLPSIGAVSSNSDSPITCRGAGFRRPTQ